MTNTIQTKTGDCEVCTLPTGIETTVYLMHGNMWMCSICRAEDVAITTKNAKNVIDFSRKIDTQVVLKRDIFEKTTTSFTQLKAAVDNNAEIPDEQKNTAFLQEVDARIKIMDAAIFEQKAALVAIENERHAMLVNAQNIVARLRESERAKFRQFDINYTPAKPTKREKSTKPVTPAKKKFSVSEVRTAATKAGIPQHASMVQAIVVSRNMNPDDAANFVVELMTKKQA